MNTIRKHARKYVLVSLLAGITILSGCGFELHSGHKWTATYSWSLDQWGGCVVHATAENVSTEPITVQWSDSGVVTVEPGDTDRYPLYGSPSVVELRVNGGLDEGEANDTYAPDYKGVC